MRRFGLRGSSGGWRFDFGMKVWRWLKVWLDDRRRWTFGDRLERLCPRSGGSSRRFAVPSLRSSAFRTSTDGASCPGCTFCPRPCGQILVSFLRSALRIARSRAQPLSLMAQRGLLEKLGFWFLIRFPLANPGFLPTFSAVDCPLGGTASLLSDFCVACKKRLPLRQPDGFRFAAIAI
ncbi:hypothetical protein JOE09_000461 [Pantoea coffeiphila]|nr:hypothetical protein [Pantoea coffeiphila]